MRKFLTTAALGGALLAAASGTAQAQPVTPAGGGAWAVSHGTARAGGTWADFLDSQYVNGQLANTGDGCYHVLYHISEDLGGRTESSPAQCGPGTISVSFTTPVDLFTQTEVMVCAGQPDENTDCGPAQWLGG